MPDVIDPCTIDPCTIDTCTIDTIHVDQAIFASSDRGRIKGYQLVSASSGVDRACSQELCRWAPTQFPSDDSETWTINFFPVSSDSVAVSRTVLGGPEYSGRGSLQVVTLFLLLRDAQFAGYGCNPIAVARTALAMGALRLPWDTSCRQLPKAQLPSRPVVESSIPAIDRCDDDDEAYRRLLDEITDLLKSSRRVAVIGLDHPLDTVDLLMLRLPAEARRNFTFTTGLLPAIRRPFRAHFLPAASATLQRTLEAQKIVCVSAP